MSKLKIFFVSWLPESHPCFHWHWRFDGITSRGMSVDFFSTASGFNFKRFYSFLRHCRNADAIVVLQNNPISVLLAFLKHIRLIKHQLYAAELNIKPTSSVLKKNILSWTYNAFDIVFPLSTAEKFFFVNSLKIRTHIHCLRQADLNMCTHPDTEAVPRDLGYVFSGGRSHRDFDSLVTAASLLSNIPFIVVSSESPKFSLPPNVQWKRNVPYADYQRLLAECRLCVLPLQNVHHACGIRVMYDCWRIGKPVLVTRTVPLRDYIPDWYEFFFPPGDVSKLTAFISKAYSDPLFRKRTISYGKSLLKSFSPDQYINSFMAVIQNDIKNTQLEVKGASICKS